MADESIPTLYEWKRLTEAKRTRLAVINSQHSAPASTNQPMPKWGWGAVKGPYQP